MREAVVAGAIAYSVDDFGTLWLRAFDTEGFLICVCMVSEEGALHLAGYIADAYDDSGDGAIGEVAGHA